MKKSKRSRSRKPSRQKVPAASEPQTMDRRRVLSLARNGGIAAAVLGGTGLFGVRSVMATVAEHDLTRVGQGKPAIVQVHDPQCPTCTALQRETRRALDSFEECDLVYLVANIRTVDGSSFANTHRAPHVTLLLFDAHGTLRQSLNGMRYRQELREVFRAHHAAYGSV